MPLCVDRQHTSTRVNTRQQHGRRIIYGKVFESMYDGTLASRGPWEALVTFQQLIVLANRDGMVDMTAEAISRRTSIPLAIIELGISELLKPDQRSRTPDEDGRRIVLIDDHRDWGWHIVNHAKYQSLRSAEERREYLRLAQAKRRERIKTEASTGVNNVNTLSVNVNTSTPAPVALPATEEDQELSAAAQPHPSADADGKPAKKSANQFNEFWEKFPNKKGKAAAERSWRAQGCDRIGPLILAHVALMAGTDSDWLRGFTPHGATYVRGKRWEDAPKQRTIGPPQAVGKVRAAYDAIDRTIKEMQNGSGEVVSGAGGPRHTELPGPLTRRPAGDGNAGADDQDVDC